MVQKFADAVRRSNQLEPAEGQERKDLGNAVRDEGPIVRQAGAGAARAVPQEALVQAYFDLQRYKPMLDELFSHWSAHQEGRAVAESGADENHPEASTEAVLTEKARRRAPEGQDDSLDAERRARLTPQFDAPQAQPHMKPPIDRGSEPHPGVPIAAVMGDNGVPERQTGASGADTNVREQPDHQRLGLVPGQVDPDMPVEQPNNGGVTEPVDPGAYVDPSPEHMAPVTDRVEPDAPETFGGQQEFALRPDAGEEAERVDLHKPVSEVG